MMRGLERLSVSVGLAVGLLALGEGRLAAQDKIDGPWGIGNPVHETLTMLALSDNSVVTANAAFDREPAREFLRGVIFNDDPCGLLFDSDTSMLPSTGNEWGLAFDRARRNEPPIQCPLLRRSHFGNLQFWHAMASAKGVPAQTTLEEIMRWAEFTYRVATGEIADKTNLSEIPIKHLARTLSDAGPKTVAALFLASTPEVTRMRALGSLLHTIQDSYAGGHTKRLERSGERGAIAQFFTNADLVIREHPHDDGFTGGGTTEQLVEHIQGGRDARDASAKVVAAFLAKKPWAEVDKELRTEVFLLSEDAQPSKPADDDVAPATKPKQVAPSTSP